MHRRAQAHIALFVVNFIYGVNYVVAKGLMPEVIGPSGFILLRVLGATLFFWLLRAWRPERIALTDLGRLALCAVFGVALNQLMFFHGLMRTSPLNASIIMVATPILVLVLSTLLIGERITWSKVLGIALGALGALSLIFAEQVGASTATSSWGDLFILINAASYGLYLVIVKPLMQRYSAITVMSWSFLFALVLVWPFGHAELAAVEWAALTPPIWLALGFVVVLVTFVAYLLNTWALGVVDPSVVGSYIYMQPVLAALFTWLFATLGAEAIGLPGQYDTSIGWAQGIAALAIFLGVHLVSRTPRVART